MTAQEGRGIKKERKEDRNRGIEPGSGFSWPGAVAVCELHHRVSTADHRTAPWTHTVSVHLFQTAHRPRMKLWSLSIVGIVVLMMALATTAEPDLWEEDERDELLVRTARGTKERVPTGAVSCRYAKGAWSECDAKSNTRTRTLNLKKGDPKTCEQTKTIQKKCKKACRYEKGSWSGCVSQLMTRVDNLKPNSDPTCEKTRHLSKRCKPESNSKKATKGDRSNKKSGKQ